jgi:hypothetical protein
MKVRMLRTMFYGADVLEDGQVIDVDNAQWWIERGYAEQIAYEVKPHPAHPMLAGGVETPAQLSPPAPRRRGRPPKQLKA